MDSLKLSRRDAGAPGGPCKKQKACGIRRDAAASGRALPGKLIRENYFLKSRIPELGSAVRLLYSGAASRALFTSVLPICTLYAFMLSGCALANASRAASSALFS